MEENYNKVNNVDGSALVKGRKIIIKNPIGNGKYATISPPLDGDLYINGEKINRTSTVKEEDAIEFKALKEPGKRIIDISFNSDKTEAYISISYKKEFIYYLKDLEETNNLILELDIEEGIEPPIITEDQLINELKKVGISYGIDKDSIEYIKVNKDINKMLVAKGVNVKPPIEDSLKIFFNYNKKIKIDENKEKIDFRDFNYITSVKANEVLAEIIKGENGVDGKSVFSERIPGKEKKKINFLAGQGCKLKDNLIISTIDGKPNFNKGTIWVEPIYILNKDVTMATGNIKFPANVQINGKVTEGMKITSGGSVFVKSGVFNAFIESKNTSEILGNVVHSVVEVGGADLVKEIRIKTLNELKEDLKSLVANVVYLKEHNLIQKDITDGMIVKLLIETKYKSVSKNCVKAMSNAMKDSCYNSEVIKLIRGKLIGAAPSNIKGITEVEGIIEELNKELEELEKETIITSDLTIEYAQESEIIVVGDINIIGKGLFTSKLSSSGNIKFCLKNSVCRGGHLKAGKCINASIVGSDSGVFTNLEVDKDGEIFVDTAYHNTIFIIGNKKYILEKPSKNVHAYIDKDSSLVVDKLLL